MTWLKKGRYTLHMIRSWTRKLRWKNIILIGLTFLIAINVAYIIIELPTLVGVDINSDSKSTGINFLMDRTLNKLSPFKPATSKIGNNLVLDTPTCKIGLGNLWPPEFVNNWNWSSNKNRVPNCDDEKKLFFYIKPDKIIKVIYEKFKDCNVREIIRKPDAPNNNYFREVNQINLTTSRFVRVGHMEMFMVVCNGFYNFEAHLLPKPQVAKKLAFWKNNAKQNENPKSTTERPMPINILWLGIDTTSRIHLHRSFPKTLKVLNDLNFIEFNGYHSIDFMTQPNFLAFLMGTPRLGNYKNECNSTFEKTWDKCPFIWKEFAKRNYVTMFLEDHVGTLNYNGPDGGFKQSPTDYYLQSLFFAQEYYQRKVNWQKADCMSIESVPQFLLGYNKHFLQKFNSTPFFTFTWFNFPFHEYDFALPNVDEDFQKFFQTLQSDPQILENTLIILNSDHGQRYGTYLRNSMEGFLERSLPPLFIRIPEKLLEKYPNLRLKEFAKMNRNRLTTAFDLHHTLLHVLSLSNGLSNLSKFPTKNQNLDDSKTDYSEFQPVLGDRSSLFAAISDNRTCNTVHIDDNMCVCNTHKSTRHITNPFEISRMIHYAIKLINTVIIDSEFESICRVWEGSLFPLYSADVLHVSDNSTTKVLLKFETEPVAKFEIQLRIVIGNGSDNGFNTIEKVTEPVRISSYGNTTLCITGKTNREKYIKEFCYCKEEDATVGRAMTEEKTPTNKMT